MNKLKKLLVGAVSTAMVLSATALPAFAASNAPTADGEYTAAVQVNKDGSTDASMCNALFVDTADVVISGEDATVTLYVAYPVPAYPALGTDGTLKNVVFTYDGQEYNAEIDIDSKPVKEFTSAGPMFGINAGDMLPCQVITVTLPKAALTEDYIDTVGFVNVLMNMDTEFDVVLSDYVSTSGEVIVDNQSMDVTAEVKEEEEPINPSTYIVTIPEGTDLGTLKADDATTTTYDVGVEITDGTDKKTITVVAEEEGCLVGTDSYEIPFSNEFGLFGAAQFSETGTEAGTLTVQASDVVGATAGSYSGTVNFSITAE